MGERRIWVADTEANSLTPDTVHCAVFKNFRTWEVKKFVQEDCYKQIPDFMNEEIDLLVGHNFYGFDLPKVFHPLLKIPFSYDKTMDTLIMSRMADPKRQGGHGLEAWGERVGVQKPVQEQWEEYTPEMLHRCTEDVEINHRVFEILLRDLKGFSKQSIRLEHQVQKILFDMERYGFFLDEEKAQRLYFDMKIRVEEMSEQLQKDFPPVSIPYNKQNEVVTPRYKKVQVKVFDDNGEPLKEISPETGRLKQVTREDKELSIVGLKVLEREDRAEDYDAKGRVTNYLSERTPHIKWTDVAGEFCPFKWQPFNPGSTTQVVERLNEAGWEPIEFNKPTESMIKKNIFVGSPKVNETNLETIPDDAPQSAKNIAKYLLCSSRMSTVEQWLDAVDKDSRVHGRINSLGARTHRAAHASPNMANIPAIDKPYGDICRECWTVPTDEEMESGKYEHIYNSRRPRTIIGCDASGIQLRVLGHYMGDPDYIGQLVSGDIHTVNMFAAGINPGECHIDEEVYKGSVKEALDKKLGKTDGVEWEGRSVSKTFIYAWLLGAGDVKITNITGQMGKELKKRFLDNLPALKHLKEVEVKKAVQQGWYEALDGRRIMIPSNHLALSAYLQGGEAIIMKLALLLFTQEIRKRKLNMFPVAFVHDEFQIDSQEDQAEEGGELAAQCIINAGKILKMKCPLDAEYKIGKSWKDTH